VKSARVRRCGATVLALVVTAALSGAAAEEPARKPRFGIYLEYEHFSYLAGTGGELVDSRNALTAIPRVDWSLTDNLFFHFAVLLRQDFSEEERSRVYPYDGFLRYEGESWSIKVGRQFITWGRADSLRPTDVFKRYDFTDLIEGRELATDAVKVDFFRGAWTLEGVWAPVFNPDIVSYRAENRWNGLPATVEVPGIGSVGLTFRKDPVQRPAATLGSGQVGLRLSGSAGGWDFAGMYYYGYDRVPTFTRREVTDFDPVGLQASVTLSPVHQRIHVIGGDVATAMAGWGLRSEAAYTVTAGLPSGVSGTNDSYFRLTTGVDRSFSRLPLGESLAVIAQYALDTAPRQPGAFGEQEVDPRLHPFRHALVVHSIWKYSEFLQVNLQGYVNLVEGDYLLKSELSWKPFDPVTVVVGGDVLGGRPNTFFGQFRENDRVRVRVAYSF
jgi:hypothetical protein